MIGFSGRRSATVDVDHTIVQTLTSVVHTQAMADAADSGVDILRIKTIAGLPAVALYLAEPWNNFLDALRSMPWLPALAEVAEAETGVIDGIRINHRDLAPPRAAN